MHIAELSGALQDHPESLRFSDHDLQLDRNSAFAAAKEGCLDLYKAPLFEGRCAFGPDVFEVAGTVFEVGLWWFPVFVCGIYLLAFPSPWFVLSSALSIVMDLQWGLEYQKRTGNPSQKKERGKKKGGGRRGRGVSA